MLLSRVMKRMSRREAVVVAQPEPGEPQPELFEPAQIELTEDTRPRVLDVGANSKLIGIPEHYAGWNHLLLDIAPGPDIDLQMDARALADYGGARFDSIYSSHNLEHFYPHDVPKVLAGFVHVLKPDGFVDIRVPDLNSVLKAVVDRGMELDDVLYVSQAGPISAHDVIYGWGAQIERSGVDFFAHKRGFSAKSLTLALDAAGFVHIHTAVDNFEVRAVAFKTEPSAAQRQALGI
ncbi:MAG TPA: methyltransferase domain-containing protein [Burkholderiaceae bacterium]|jgi:SAM-dependent methyltransferase